MFPVYSLPPILYILSYLFPLTYFVPITNGIFIKGVGLEALWPEVAGLLAIITVIFFVGVRFFKQRLD
jgi:ABC-2 type transport system permease protein